MKSLYSVIVNWNLQDDTLACIASLLEAGSSPENIVVVDNHSTDGSINALLEKYGHSINLIENDKNLGYAAGLNIGISHAMSQGAQWVFVLNNDTIVDPLFYEELDHAIQSEPNDTIFGPLILNYYHPEQIWFLGDKLLPGLLFTRSVARGSSSAIQLPAVISVDFITGCAMVINRQVFEKIGLFSTEYFMYAEDVDFCWRANLAGFHIASITRAKMWHKISASSRQDRPLSRYWRTRNQIVFYRKYAHFYQLPILLGLSSIRLIGILFKDVCHSQSRLITPLLKGWADGWFSKPTQIIPKG